MQLTEKQIKLLNVEVSKVLGTYVEFEEVEQRDRHYNENLVMVESKPINQNLGLFGRCFYDLRFYANLYKQTAEGFEGTLAGQIRTEFKYHDGGSNGASPMLQVVVWEDKVEVTDFMKNSAQNRKPDFD